MGDAFKGLVLVGQRDRRAGVQGVCLSLVTKARDRLGRFAEEFLPQILLDAAEWWAPVDAAEVLEGAVDIH
eukprot:103615-Lingulodinium_polyedra.AAC.1